MSHSPVVFGRGGRLLLPRELAVGAQADAVVIQPEFTAGSMAAFPEVRLVRARCGDGAPCEARCPAGSRPIAAGDDGRAAAWVMCA